jgi:hypothetical protein
MQKIYALKIEFPIERIPFKSYLLLAFLTVGTMGLSNGSLPYLNYPTQVMFKCCKLIPVLVGGILIQVFHFLSKFLQITLR